MTPRQKTGEEQYMDLCDELDCNEPAEYTIKGKKLCIEHRGMYRGRLEDPETVE